MTRSRDTVFVVYSHEDARWLERLQVHLKPLERQGLVERWDDTKIAPGTSWRGEIRKALEHARVAVILISADFLASDFIAENELPPLLAAAETEGVVILPIITSPSMFTNVPELARFQPVNSPDEPLSSLSKADQEKTLVHATDVILKSLSKPNVVMRGVSAGREINLVTQTTTWEPGFSEVMRQLALVQEQLTELRAGSRSSPTGSRRIFIVHGHDDAAKEMIARFLAQLGLEPVILHEQPNEGRAIIEKFERNSDVDFAVVLLTPDDVGYARPQQNQAKPRARQNVIMELGFFIGTLGRTRVCALCKGDVEIPSDYHGVVYLTMDEGEGWKMVLAREIKKAGINVDLNRAI